MSEMSGQCELCYNRSNQISIRVFPCLYHCKKMLCIQHLSEHEKYTENQIQLQKELENLWKNFHLIFDENKVEEQLQTLKAKLENYRKLKEEVNGLLLINHFHDSIENNRKFQLAIQTVQRAIEQENQPKLTIHDVHPKIELVMNDDEEHRSTLDYASLSSSLATNDESGPIESPPSLLNNNENSPPDEESLQQMNGSENHTDSPEMDNEDEIPFKDETNITPSRSITASTLRDYCPLTRDGVFGIDSGVHGIRLCVNENQRPCLLNEHFRRVHHLTPLASLALARAMVSGQDPMDTRLFSHHHIILNIDELRTVNCPIDRPFLHYPSLEIENSPCDTIKQVRHLKDHLKRVHKFTTQAANLIVKSVKNDALVYKIQFPHWLNILQNAKHL